MHALLLPAFTGLIVILGAVLLVWLVSLIKQDVSIVDIFWGVGFVCLTWLYYNLGEEDAVRQHILLILVSLWGMRLALYLLWRNWNHGEDRRYQAMRTYRGANFWWLSLFTIFFLQGFLIWIIAAPLLVTQFTTPQPTWIWTDTLGVLLWSTGFFFEVVGDWQLMRFKANPANHGRVMRQGLWAYTRHPNYFGDALVWWGYFFFALAIPGGGWTIISPILMTFLLLKVSGVALLEQTIAERCPDYQEYIANTSAFIPWVSRSRSSQ